MCLMVLKSFKVYYTYCNSIHSSTNETPFFLVHGRDPNLLIDVILNDVRNRQTVTPQDYRNRILEKLSVAFNLVKENLKSAKEHDFRVGDRVLLDVKIINKEQLTLKFTMPGSMTGRFLERLRTKRNKPSPSKIKNKSEPITSTPIIVKLKNKIK